jgi:hypothetical protein
MKSYQVIQYKITWNNPLNHKKDQKNQIKKVQKVPHISTQLNSEGNLFKNMNNI